MRENHKSRSIKWGYHCIVTSRPRNIQTTTVNVCSYLILNGEYAGVFKELVANLQFLNYL
jgi:hypothetical protein